MCLDKMIYRYFLFGDTQEHRSVVLGKLWNCGSLGISLHSHSRINIQTCIITGFGVAIDTPVTGLANGANGAVINLIVK